MNLLRLKRTGLCFFLLAVGFIQGVIAQNFSFTIEPSTLTLVAGQQATFVISLTPLDGFTNQVTLSLTNLPSGVTESFSPATLTPPGTSLLTLSATTTAAAGSFDVNIVAAGGGITNTATNGVRVTFGLLHVCYGAFEGMVTDVTTGLPLTNATVIAGGYYGATDSNGFYIITNLPLSGSENLPVDYSVTAEQTDYWPSTSNAYAICDLTNTVNLQLLREQTGSISGIVTSSEGGEPLTNVTVMASYLYTYYAVTDTNGFYQFESLPLGNDNTPADYSVRTQPSGYWPDYTSTNVQANSNSVVNLVLIPVCDVTVSGKVIYGDTGLPATNIYVTIGTSGSFSGITDSTGTYTITNVTLGSDNTPVTASIAASTPGYNTGYTNLPLTGCGGGGSFFYPAPIITLTLIPPPPQQNYGSIAGFVYDLQTGAPVTNAYVDGSSTDTNGAYFIPKIYVGSGTVTNVLASVFAVAGGYFDSGSSNVEVYANETSMQNLYVLRIGYGEVAGTVFNASTGVPVSGIYVNVGGFAQTTGADGRYASGPIQLNPGNTPAYVGISAQETGYWTTYTNTTVTNGITNIVNIEIIEVCTGATIVGNVVDAVTQQPITNATINVSTQYEAVMTDTNGDFIITNLTVGNQNSPIQTTLTAMAPGYNPQSKTLTIFCDATISTEFGAPEIVFGAIDGYVTNAITGQPLTNVFIGSSYGAATTTDTNGHYILLQAPLGANGSNRTWNVTAGPVTIGAFNYPALTKSVVVSANTTNLLDFGFGQAPTYLTVTGNPTPSPVTVGSNLLYAITLTNSAADAANVVLADTLPPNVTFVGASVSNNPGGVFSAPVLSNGVVTIMATNFSPNSVVVLLINVTPTAAGILTNSAGVTSDTPDPSTNQNVTLLDTAVAPVAPPLYADIGLTMTNTPDPVFVSNQLTYTLHVTNLGPSNAPGVVLTDSLPANVSLSSAVVSQGNYALIPNGLQWNLGALADNGTASATIVILPLQTGEFTNTATVSITPTVPPVTDTNLANNTASVVATAIELPAANWSIQFGPISTNWQTGLFQQTVQVNNLSGAANKLVSVAVLGLPSYVTLYNATGTSNGVPYFEYNQLVSPGSNVVFLLEYYVGTRRPFVSTNFVVTNVTFGVSTPTGPSELTDRPAFTNEAGLLQWTIEFTSVPGHTYVVQYSSNMETWLTAAPPIVATNTRTLWIDSGPPVTQSPPGSADVRMYRVLKTN